MSNYQAMKFIPSDIATIRIQCDHCNHIFKPNWLKDRGGHMGSIQAGDSTWVRSSAFEPCPRCSSNISINIPVVEQKSSILFFGDEASRVFNNSSRLYTYSLIGTSRPYLSSIENDIKSLKRDLVPDMDPEEWKIHMTIIWSGQQRKKRPEYNKWKYETTQMLIEGIREIIQSNEDKIFRYNILLGGRPLDSKQIKEFEFYVQHEAYILLIMNVINEVTKLGAQPIFNFDSIKNATSDNIIHAWAKKAFEHGSSNLLYSFLSHSIVVPEPIFVPPGSKPLLELADIMSFAVARHHYRKLTKQPIDIDLTALGRVVYMTFTENGNRLNHQVNIGYPWNFEI